MPPSERTSVDALATFLKNAIESIDRLDVLRLLEQTPSRSWSASAVARELSLSIDVSQHALEALCARGLLSVTLGSDLSYMFRPIDRELETLARSLAELHDERPDEVCALLQPSTRAR